MRLDEPCGRCPAPAVRTLGTTALCATCAEVVLAPIRARALERGELVAPFAGRGRSLGTRPDSAVPGLVNVVCDRCGATWLDWEGAPCPWCERRHRKLLEDQAELVLEPPDVDPSSTGYELARRAWAERLARAVQAGVIDEASARAALTRGAQSHAA